MSATTTIDDARRRHDNEAGARVLPHDVQAEESLLGAMLLSKDAVAAAVGLVAPDDFYKPAHGHIFEAMVELYARGRPVDHVTVADELRQRDRLQKVGGASVFASLVARTPSTGNAGSYAEIIWEHSRNRSVALAAENVREAVLARADLAPALRRLEAATAARSALLPAGERLARVDGATFVLDVPTVAEPIWGDGERVAWAAGEPLLINGPAGVGKTTIAQQLTLARAGMRSEVLGLPVLADDRPVLYIAADRPTQAARSLRRMVGEEDREVLAERLIVWRGPLPATLNQAPDALAKLAEEIGVGTVVVDSLKDVAGALSDEQTGTEVNRALQLTCLAGVEVLVLHHQRKRISGGEKPKTLDDVYGSTWITAGAGSVLLVWGQAGDAVVELSHLKQPAEPIGPLTLLHDHDRGLTIVQGEVDLLDVVRTSNGLTVQGAARALFDKESPKANEIERARRRLEQLCKKGLVHREDPKRGGDGGSDPARYYAVDHIREAS